jgi:CBS domain-containing protein
MELKEFISYHVEAVGPDDSLKQAAAKMRDLDVGSMPVCEGNRVIGMVTDRDITIRATAAGEDPTTTKVGSVMTPDVVYCTEDDTTEEAARLMQEHQIRRLLVLNQDRELVGIVSLGELSTATGDWQLGGETLERVSDPAEYRQAPEPALEEEEPETSAGKSLDTRVTGLFKDSEEAKKTVLELKDAGFADRILVAMNNTEAQDNFLADTQVLAAPVDEIPTLPELDAEQVLVLVDAAGMTPLAVEIINRHHGITGGVRMQS